MTKKNVIVHEFDPVIYPRKVWITISKNSYFEGFNDLPEMDKSMEACVCKAHNNIRDLGGIFIRFSDMKSMSAGNITHESIHAAMEIFDYVGAFADIKNQEPLCYLAGWIAKCCEQVKNNKINKDE